MRIFIIPSWYPSEKRPEECIFIQEQAIELQKNGHEIVVLYADLSENCKKITDSYLNEIRVIKKSEKAFLPSRFRMYRCKKEHKILNDLYNYATTNIFEPELVYAHFSFPAGFAASIISKKHGIPLVTIEHYSFFMRRKIDFQLKRILRKTINNSSTFICVSENLKKSVLAHTKSTGDKIIVISNMIDPRFRFIKTEKKEKFVFLAIGSLINRKGFDVLIKAFEKACRNNLKFELRIGGDGPEREPLQQLVQKLKLDNVVFLGQLSREDTLREYIYSDCFVLASRAETYGLVYREAMAVGRPIISTKHDGFNENEWDEKCGYLVEVDDVDGFSDSMQKLFIHYNEYDLEYISKKCLSLCSSSVVIANIEQAFLKSVGGDGHE